MINRERLTKTFCDLVSIDSPSGEEEKVRNFIQDKLSAIGFETCKKLIVCLILFLF